MIPTAEAQDATQSQVYALIFAAFIIGAVLYFGGYFYFLHLQKKSREQGRQEAEREEKDS